ncbi:MAG TPA: extracellular solute-binding protein [Nitrososphaeraceae archaeon]|nr:extracellular solute-binding protein [Nitrososphaeraceae archaeon]
MSIVEATSIEKNNQVMLRAILTDLGDPNRWQTLLQPALEELRKRHPDLDIQLNHATFPYNMTRAALLESLSNKTAIDLISVDQIWLGELAEKGFLADLTNRTQEWGKLADFYEANLDGTIFNDRIYGIWAWTDVRGIWYWKDILNKSDVSPNSLRTWDGYLAAAKKINSTIQAEKEKGTHTLVQPIHLNGDVNAPDVWYPYLWMLGGSIVENRPGHPTKDSYWFPSYNSTNGVKALEFLKKQTDIGLKPQSRIDDQFVDRKFAVMLSGSWMPSSFRNGTNVEQIVGFLPVFPVPDASVQTTTMMGGWQISIPSTSTQKDLAWELITIMLEPEIFAPWLQQYGYLPTQSSIGEGPYSTQLRQSIPYYQEMISMIEVGGSRPSIPEYSEIATHIKQAMDEVFSGAKEPKQALDDAAAKSAKVLGWS